MKTDIINNWRPEVRSLLNRLIAAGCKIRSVDNGEETTKFKEPVDLNHVIRELTACDSTRLYVTTPDAPSLIRWLYIVLGNDPGELVSDYVVDPVLDAVTEAHYNEWEGKPQPKATREAIQIEEQNKSFWTVQEGPADGKTIFTSPGRVGRACELPNACEMRLVRRINGSGSTAFGGAKSWPAVQLTVSFQEGEEAKREALAYVLREAVDKFFGRVA